MTAPTRFEFTAMGTNCELLLYADSPEDAERAAEAAIGEAQRIERAYSRYRPDSIVHAINMAAQAAGAISVDDETALLIDAAFDAFQRSGGLFDITSGVLREVWNGEMKTLPSQADIDRLKSRIGLGKVSWQKPVLAFSERGMEIDLGGIGKEYAADRAAQICASLGAVHAMVSLGGDIAIAGPQADGSPWRIGVCDPRQPETAIVTLFAEAGGIATSGDYERFWEIGGQRYGHILNPLTGWPAAGAASITVAAETCLAAGLCATIAMLKGEDGPAWLRDNDMPHVIIGEDGTLATGSIQSPESTDV